MYLDYYQLKLKPFQITADPKFLWLGEKHKEALATLRYGIVDNRGFLLLTGEVGTGKTILINRLTTLLDMDTVVATLPDPDLDSMDFYNLLADGLQMKRTFDSKGAFLIHLRDFLHQSYVDQKQVLLIIDEAQRLNHRLMEDIRVLSNIELHDRKLINIFFVGQQEFNSILMTPQNRALSQRITVRYHIDPLNQDETSEYVAHRLKIAGRAQPIFNKAALKEIFYFSDGIPRLINIISDHALLTGYSGNLKRIDGPTIKECAEELRIPIQPSSTTAATIKPSRVMRSQDQKRSTPQVPSAQAASQNPPSEAVAGKDDVDRSPESPLIWKIGYALLVLGLIAVVAYAISQFSGGETDRYDVADLTPDKYKTTLEREKAILSDHLNGQNTELQQGDKGNDNPLEPSTTKVIQAVPQTPAGDATRSPVATDVEAPPGAAAQSTGAPAADSTEVTPVEPLVDMSATLQEKAKPATDPDLDAEIADPLEPSRADGPILSSDSLTPRIEPLPLMDETITIPFGINSNEIDAQYYGLLDQVADYLVRHPAKFISIRGYTDTSGSPGYNLSVSRFRASAVKSYLIGKGAYPQNIEVIAMGDKNPIAPNTSYEGRIKNRRVEIQFSNGQSAGE